MLPGRGMNVLQITAYIPGKGEVNLMTAPSVDGAASAMTGSGDDTNGRASLAMGGAFEVPWAGDVYGTSISGGSGEESGHENIAWRGRSISLPATGGGAAGGLLLAQPADAADTVALPDGGHAQATFHAGDFGGHWPSKTDVTVTVLLSSRTIELTLTARNAGDTAEPIGIGWAPRFAIPTGGRAQERLTIPAQKREEIRDRAKGVPSGVLVPVAGTAYDFSTHGGAVLGNLSLDDCFVDLHQNLLDSGPVAELSVPADNYGLRMTVLSSTIKAIHVLAPAGADFLSIAPQFNYDDPFGREWGKDADTGMVVLQPGQSTQWKVRVELFSLGSSESSTTP
jgi:aldose 1-epimerase